MVKYLRDVSFWFSPQQGNAFNLACETNFLEVLYLDCLPKVETEGIAKVVIHPCQSVDGDPLKLINNPDVIQFSKEFDFELYERSDKQAKKRIALEFLHSSLMEVARLKKWDSQPFLNAYHGVLAKNLVCERSWGKAVAGPKRIKAVPWCHYDSDKAAIYIAFFKGAKLIGKVWVTDAKPGDVWINQAVGKLEWESERDVKLSSRDGSVSWRCSLPV